MKTSVSSIDNIKPLISYFNKYTFLGVKGNDYKQWEIVYIMMVFKEHLTEQGRLKFRSLVAKIEYYKIIN